MSDLGERWIKAMRGDRFADAWALSDEALAGRDPATRDDPDEPYHRRWVWDGRPFDGRDVLVRCYHGLGDTIQFARFLPMLGRRVKSLTVEAQPHLLPLLSRLLPAGRLVPFDPARPLPPAECDLEITELPHALRAAPSDAPVPYLTAARAALPDRTVGLCYSAGDWDQDRWVPPALLKPLCRGRSCLTLVAGATELPVLNAGGCPMDIAVTASLLASVELVITVDTMIAHLAGALGRPTWLLLKADPDWRWSPDRADTPWYPSMRVYAQPTPGDWPSVIGRVARDLDLFLPTTTAEGAPVHGESGQSVRPRLLG